MGDYIEQEEVINSAWIGVEDIKIILPIKTSTAREIVKKIVDDMRLNDEMYFETRPRLIPTRKIVEKYGIDVNLIRKEADKMRKYRKE